MILKCPDCRAPIPEGASYCEMCGLIFRAVTRWFRFIGCGSHNQF